jgi:hypothetical protein
MVVDPPPIFLLLLAGSQRKSVGAIKSRDDDFPEEEAHLLDAPAETHRPYYLSLFQLVGRFR